MRRRNFDLRNLVLAVLVLGISLPIKSYADPRHAPQDQVPSLGLPAQGVKARAEGPAKPGEIKFVVCKENMSIGGGAKSAFVTADTKTAVEISSVSREEKKRSARLTFKEQRDLSSQFEAGPHSFSAPEPRFNNSGPFEFASEVSTPAGAYRIWKGTPRQKKDDPNTRQDVILIERDSPPREIYVLRSVKSSTFQGKQYIDTSFEIVDKASYIHLVMKSDDSFQLLKSCRNENGDSFGFQFPPPSNERQKFGFHQREEIRGDREVEVYDEIKNGDQAAIQKILASLVER